MEQAEFEEKQYETAFLWELATTSSTLGPHQVYSPGQVVEAVLGYDTALGIDQSPIWNVLSTDVPPGIVLTPSMWLPLRPLPNIADLPPRLVSLILQFKRPEYLDHWRAGQYHRWKGGYFRFYTRPHQQARLETLERGLDHRAVVRYAAPAFLTNEDLWRAGLNHKICEMSAYVSPSWLGSPHRLWSYPGPGLVGYANPEGENTEGDTIESLFELLNRRARSESLADHVTGLAADLQIEPPLNEGLEQFLSEQPQERRDAIRGWVVIAGTVALTGAAWLVLGFD